MLLRESDESITAITEQLLKDGYVVLDDAMLRDDVTALREDLQSGFDETPFCQGGFYGARTKRFGRLLARSPRAAGFVQHETILPVVERVLGAYCDTIQLNLTQAIALHPGALPQFPHRDQDMWRGEVGRVEYLVNVMWPFTDYRADNGATLIWPHSHGGRCHDPEPAGEPVVATMKPGAALLFLGSTLHGAGRNLSNTVREGMIVSYCLGWLKPYENQWLAYPPEVARTFSKELAGLAGYRQHRPNLGNYEGQCPSILLEELAPGVIGAVDALRPDQAEGVAAYVASQST